MSQSVAVIECIIGRIERHLGRHRQTGSPGMRELLQVLGF